MVITHYIHIFQEMELLLCIHLGKTLTTNNNTLKSVLAQLQN